MTLKKAEKLARELMALRLRFSDQDFHEAISLIASGRSFELPLAAAREAASISRSRVQSGRSEEGQARSAGARSAISKLEQQVAGNDDVQAFLTRFIERDILKSGSAIRGFAEAVGLQLPRKLPSRIAVAGHFIRKLLKLPPGDRSALVQRAFEPELEGSTLQLWSNLIVKDNQK